MPEIIEEQQAPQERQEKLHYSAEEFSNFLKHREREDEILSKIDKGDVIGYMDAENKRWLTENTESPEQAKELLHIYENAKKLQETVAKFSDDDIDIPASEETKEKLKLLEVADHFIGDKDKHEIALATFLLPTLSAGVVETLNFFGGGSLPPGLSAKVGLAIGAAMSGSIEGYNLVRKGRSGAEKVKSLIAKYKPAVTEVLQSPETQTG